MKVLRKIIEIDEELCDGCGQCIPGCAEGALAIVDGKARVVAEVYCDGLGACIGECPNDALKLVEREADEFDEAEVEKHLERLAREEEASEKAPKEAPKEASKPSGCPSAMLQTFTEPSPCKGANKPAAFQGTSALSHWPVQIKLIPANAPFLKNADLLILADCVAVAFASLHTDLMKDKVVMMGCPKFDDVQEYVQKFTDIFKIAGIKSVTTAYMEVPCCSGLPSIVQKGMKAARKEAPMKHVVISTRGELVKDTYTP